METARIVVSGPGTRPGAPPRTWTGTVGLRVGRLTDLEVVLDDDSVSRLHAELVPADDGWMLRDLGSSNGTFLNGTRIGRTGRAVRKGDTVLFGRVLFRVEVAYHQPAVRIHASGQMVRVESTAERTWDEALAGLDPTDDQWDRHGRSLLRIMRGGTQLAHATSLDEGLRDVLADAVRTFSAQRGGVFLLDRPNGDLVARCTAGRDGTPAARPPSRTLAARALKGGKSLLFTDSHDDPAMTSESIAGGAMASIICAVLRSPDAPPFTQADLYLADSLAAAIALGAERHQLVERQNEQILQTVTALAQAVELRDRYTGGHTDRVTRYALILADELRLPAADRKLLGIATPLHDIGKIAVDDGVLRKPGRLTDAEFGQMKTHVLSGVDILEMIPALSWALPVVRSHHEKWNGSGYPDGLRGESIPLVARVVAVADAFDAMTSDRPYRKGMAADEAFAELEANAGTHFDPRCVAAFVAAREKVEALLGREAKMSHHTELATHTISARELEEHRRSGASPLG